MNLANLKALFMIPKWAKFFISISSIIILLLLIAVLLLNQITLSEINSAIENPPPLSNLDIFLESTKDTNPMQIKSWLWDTIKYYIWLIILVFLLFSNILRFIATTDNKKVQILLATIAFIAMSASFYNNAFGIENDGHFKSWQRDAESHIIARSLADIYGLETQGYGLGFLKAGDDIQTYGEGSDKILAEGIVPQSYAPYKSAIGIQGYMWSFVYRYFNDVKLKSTQTHLKDLKPLYVICSALNAISILIVAFLLGKIFGRLFGVVFIISMFLSPWITNYGNNLYHNFYAWLMPSMFSFSIFLLLYKNGNHKKPKIVLLSIGYVLSLFFKSLMSYEYLTSIVLFSLSPFFIAPFLAKMKFIDMCPPLKKLAKQTAMLFALAVLGFCFAFSIHTYMRGNGDFVAGVESIYKGDFLRRMVGGNARDFYEPELAESLMNANAFQVIAKYLDWHSPIVMQFNFRGNFYVLLIINILLLIFVFKGAQRRLLVAMSVVFALPAISWFVFGKTHSYIHTHMNFVLWYLGFIAVLLYIPIVATLQSK